MSGVDLKFANLWSRIGQANFKSKTPLETAAPIGKPRMKRLYVKFP
jgi:hypothetical protein